MSQMEEQVSELRRTAKSHRHTPRLDESRVDAGQDCTGCQDDCCGSLDRTGNNQ